MTADISVIICTRNRAEMLRVTLACLAKANQSNAQIETVIVDNGSGDDTREVANSFQRELAVRYLFEPTQGNFGKSHALNAALDAPGLADLVAVLDDDMSVKPDWSCGVLAITRRWPDADFFTGRTHAIWPSTSIPVWATHPGIQGWLFSCQAGPDTDRPLRAGQWFPGGHFWFRSRVLGSRRRFEDTWFTEPKFMLQLVEDGHRGARGPDAIAGHRVQACLFDADVALKRAERAGRGFADARLQPYRPSLRNARWARNHPLAARFYCMAAWLSWSSRCFLLRAVTGDSPRFADRLFAVERRANYREALRILRRVQDYRCLPTRASRALACPHQEPQPRQSI